MLQNKKELFDSLGSELQGFDKNGQAMVYSCFDMEPARADAILNDANENIGDYLKELKEQSQSGNTNAGFGISPVDFIKIAARNIELDTPNEVLHFVYCCGAIQARIAELAASQKAMMELFGKFKESGVLEEIKREIEKKKDDDDLGAFGHGFSLN
jgi:hypothetical protein